MVQPVAAQTQLPSLAPFLTAARKKDFNQINLSLKNIFGPEADLYLNPLLLNFFMGKQRSMIAHMNELTLPTPMTPPLHKAALQGDLKTLSAATKAQLVQPDIKGLTPLHYALLGQQMAAVDFLIGESDLTYAPKSGETYLHFAALTANAALVERLLPKVSAARLDAQGFSAAHYWAAASPNLEILKQLFANGAPMKGASMHDLSPLAVAVLRAFETNQPLWSLKDSLLAILNIGKLACFSEMYRISHLRPFDPSIEMSGTEFVSYMLASSSMATIELVQRFLIQNINPGQPKGVLGWVGSWPAFFAADFFDSVNKAASRIKHADRVPHPGLPVDLFKAINSAAATGVLAKRTLAAYRATGTLAEKATALSLESFNTGCALLSAVSSLFPQLHTDPAFLQEYQDLLFSNLTFQKWTEYEGSFNPFPTSECTPQDPNHYTNMSLLERLRDPKLADSLGAENPGPGCIRNAAILLDPLNPPETCDAAKAIYRSQTKFLHPDWQSRLPESKRCETSARALLEREKPLYLTRCLELQATLPQLIRLSRANLNALKAERGEIERENERQIARGTQTRESLLIEIQRIATERAPLSPDNLKYHSLLEAEKTKTDSLAEVESTLSALEQNQLIKRATSALESLSTRRDTFSVPDCVQETYETEKSAFCTNAFERWSAAQKTICAKDASRTN